MHLIEGVATEVYNAYFPHSIALSDAVNLAAKGRKLEFFSCLKKVCESSVKLRR